MLANTRDVVVRASALEAGKPSFHPSRVIQSTLKIVVMASLLGARENNND